MGIRAVVVGAGWAGEGYTRALRAAGAEVVALCGRDRDAAEAMAAKLAVAELRLDWREAIEDLRPDVVVVATPARSHRDIVALAAERGCHILCEKPLGLTADQALEMLTAVEAAGVRHAYGSTGRFAPAFDEARELVAGGVIGDVTDIQASAHFGMPRLTGHSWLHSLGDGGGVLFNALPHFLGQVQHLIGGAPRWVAGSADPAVERVPVGPVVHDFREHKVVDPETAAAGEWREVDADLRSTVIAGWEDAAGRSVGTLWHASAFSRAREPAYLEIVGTEGDIFIRGAVWPISLEYQGPGQEAWTEGRPSPVEYTEDPVQYGWNQLVTRFLSDLRGDDSLSYPTFHDGLLGNRVIDIVRNSQPEPVPGTAAPSTRRTR